MDNVQIKVIKTISDRIHWPKDEHEADDDHKGSVDDDVADDDDDDEYEDEDEDGKAGKLYDEDNLFLLVDCWLLLDEITFIRLVQSPVIMQARWILMVVTIPLDTKTKIPWNVGTILHRSSLKGQILRNILCKVKGQKAKQ